MRRSCTTVLLVLNAEDIEGLLAAGAPADEYETEARLISEALEHLPDDDALIDRVTAIVTEVWNRMFGPFRDEEMRRRVPVYRRVAKAIISAT